MSENLSQENLVKLLLDAIDRAEKAAQIAQKAALEAQKAAGKFKRSKKKINSNFQEKIDILEKDTQSNTDSLKQEILEIVKKASKKNKALKKIAKMNLKKQKDINDSNA